VTLARVLLTDPEIPKKQWRYLQWSPYAPDLEAGRVHILLTNCGNYSLIWFGRIAARWATLDEPSTRAMMCAGNVLAKGIQASSIVAERCQMLNAGIHPVIPSRVCRASGDLAPWRIWLLA